MLYKFIKKPMHFKTWSRSLFGWVIASDKLVYWNGLNKCIILNLKAMVIITYEDNNSE